MKKILFTLALLISFSSFGQHIEPTNPNDDREHMIYYNKGYEKFEAKDYYGQFTNSQSQLKPLTLIILQHTSIEHCVKQK